MNTTGARFDHYIFDTLLRDLTGHDKKPSSFLVYAFLWSQSLGQGRPSFAISHRELAESTGLSKSAVQASVRHLVKRQLITKQLKHPTATPEYTPLRPWMRRSHQS
jgi:DNA-binding MarR family transcriptional regulator